MAVETTDLNEANHITGDYYWYNDVPARRWIATAVLCFVLPPIGLFFFAYFAFACLKTESELTD